ncbi:hypothetical protein [Terrihabitans rhizophilus]|uniref:Uncharacterized protein n=1 Tax=Terrihabitans rhizophilus TaxID=3092662 RepID=A0ABU4RLB5_9HYPH|nr:hypothetical protein [Terrihabitans sp. PJ23]MDX6805376.1 hypothetical protein [Terrihabitans sp. PJ23]
MAHRQLAAWTALSLLAGVPARAENPNLDVQPEPQAISCDEADFSADLREVCDSLAENLSAVMQAPSGAFTFARVKPKPLTRREQVRTTVIASGLDAKRDLLNPFEGAPDKAVGVQVVGTTLPLELSTQVIQPGDPSSGDRLAWELKANPFRGREGIFVSGTAAGNYDSAGGQETVTARAGYRSSVQILDNVRIGSEIAPQLNWTEAAATAAVEPKLTTSASFDRLGDTGLSATLSGDVGYNLPAEGEPSAHGALRLTFRQR